MYADRHPPCAGSPVANSVLGHVPRLTTVSQDSSYVLQDSVHIPSIYMFSIVFNFLLNVHNL